MASLFKTEVWDPSQITDQSGKTFLITGSNAGLGFEAAKTISQKNGHVIMATRNPDKANEYVDVRSIRHAGTPCALEI